MISNHAEKHRKNGQYPAGASKLEDDKVVPHSEEELWRLNRMWTVSLLTDGLPLSLGEGDGMRWFLQKALQGFKPNSHGTILRNHVKPLYELMRATQSRGIVPGTKYSICIDGWKCPKSAHSASNRSCVGVAAYAINNQFELEVHAVAVRRVRGSHSSETLYATVLEVLSDWGLKVEDVVSSTTDNHNTETKVSSMLRDKFGVAQMRCICHTIQLAIRDLFALVDVVKDIGNSAHELVSVLGEFGTILEALEAEQVALGKPVLRLLQDVCTRWNSTYRMLDRLWTVWPELQVILKRPLCTTNSRVSDAYSKVKDVVTDIPFLLTILAPFKAMTELMESLDGFASMMPMVSDKLVASIAKVKCFGCSMDVLVSFTRLQCSIDVSRLRCG